MQLNLTCDACGQLVGCDGYVHADMAAVSERSRVMRDRLLRHSLTRAPASDRPRPPDLVPWRVHHALCDPEIGADHYWIESARLITAGDLLHWDSHLVGKTWLAGTDWFDFLRQRLRACGYLDPE